MGSGFLLAMRRAVAIRLTEAELEAWSRRRRRGHQEFLRFLKQLDAETPAGLDPRLVVDDDATHKHPKVRTWLGHQPRPTCASPRPAPRG